MLKLAIVGLIGALSAAGGAVMALTMQQAPATEADQHSAAVIERVSTELTAVPVVHDGKVTGYLVLKVSSSIDKSLVKNAGDALTPYLSDAAFRAAFDFAAGGVTEIKAKHIEDMSAEIARLANQKLGADAVKSVDLEQFNLVPASKIRGNRVTSD